MKSIIGLVDFKFQAENFITLVHTRNWRLYIFAIFMYLGFFHVNKICAPQILKYSNLCDKVVVMLNCESLGFCCWYCVETRKRVSQLGICNGERANQENKHYVCVQNKEDYAMLYFPISILDHHHTTTIINAATRFCSHKWHKTKKVQHQKQTSYLFVQYVQTLVYICYSAVSSSRFHCGEMTTFETCT